MFERALLAEVQMLNHLAAEAEAHQVLVPCHPHQPLPHPVPEVLS
jgi:hypothetical protein